MKKNNMLSSLLLIFLIGFSTSVGYGQEIELPEKEKNRNAIYGDFSILVVWHAASLSYERRLKENIFNKNLSSFVRLGGGYIGGYEIDPGGPFVTSHYGWLLGKKSHHLEGSLGVYYGPEGIYFDNKPHYILIPSGGLGYRYQEPAGTNSKNWDNKKYERWNFHSEVVPSIQEASCFNWKQN